MARQATPDILGEVLAVEPDGVNRLEIRRQLQWDYGQVAPIHRQAVEDAAVEIAVSGRRMTSSVMAIGGALITAKGLLAHGQFEDWCRVEFGMSERTAQNMMNVARTFEGKSAKISLLSDSTLYLLAAPSTPEPVREAVIEQAESTGRSPSVAEVKATIRLYVNDLESIVIRWIDDVWRRNNAGVPDNPSHTNGQFWQQLTAWMHANVRDTWAESELKVAIQNVVRRTRHAQIADRQVQTGADAVARSQAAVVEYRQQVAPPQAMRTVGAMSWQYLDWLHATIGSDSETLLAHVTKVGVRLEIMQELDCDVATAGLVATTTRQRIASILNHRSGALPVNPAPALGREARLELFAAQYEVVLSGMAEWGGPDGAAHPDERGGAGAAQDARGDAARVVAAER